MLLSAMAFAKKLAANTVQANARMADTAWKELQEIANKCMKDFMSRCSEESHAGKDFCVWQTPHICLEGLVTPNISPEMLCLTAKEMLDTKMEKQFNAYEVLFDFGEVKSKKNPPKLVWVCNFKLTADWGRDRMQKEMVQQRQQIAQREKQEADRRRLRIAWKGDCHPTEFPVFHKLAMKFEMEPIVFLQRMEIWVKNTAGVQFAKSSRRPSPKDICEKGLEGPDEYIRKKADGFVHEVIDAQGKSEKEEYLPEEFQKIMQWTLDWVLYKNDLEKKGKWDDLKKMARPGSEKIRDRH